MSHSLEPWTKDIVDDDDHDPHELFDTNGELVLGDPYILSDANAERIVACVNACAGIPTKTLKAEYFTQLWDDIKAFVLDIPNYEDAGSIVLDAQAFQKRLARQPVHPKEKPCPNANPSTPK